MLKPAGNYGVGYQDIQLTNKHICPDRFYLKNKNESDFSPSNKKYCHEIMLRVYYPSKKTGLGGRYYAPDMLDWINWMVGNSHLTKLETAKLNSILSVRTYAHADSKQITDKKFPIVIFMSGSGQPAQNYNNVISSLVSNGYIVIGVNSLFINGALELSSGRVVLPPKVYWDRDGQAVNLGDLQFVLNKLARIKYKHNLTSSMNFNNIELIGHSRGAMTIVHYLERTKGHHIKSIVLMDPENMAYHTKYPLPKFNIPTMTMWSSWYKNDRHAVVTPGKNIYEVVLAPDSKNKTYSNHENFSDFSTLQYHSALQMCKVRRFLTKTGNEQVGAGNGDTIAKAINNRVLRFSNIYMKNNRDEKLPHMSYL
ncbi:MAG: hypothetical protein KAS93_00065 [Gammaproteobacteria bacterium]|nr:hypothetical protein [Gammaproteobacteria bacterium]